MKRYTCFKEVDAAKIIAEETMPASDSIMLTLEVPDGDVDKIPVSSEWYKKNSHDPSGQVHALIGGMYVVYAGGYASWSPADQFEGGYREITGVSHVHESLIHKKDFAAAMCNLKAGKKVAREGWNGKGMFIFLTEGREVPNNKERSFAYFEGDTVTLGSHIDMKAADGTYVSGWLASQTDLLAEDWVIIE